MNLYGIESYNDYWGDHFRWYSKYNGARGPWGSKKEAIEGGKEHEEIIKSFFAKTENPKTEGVGNEKLL